MELTYKKRICSIPASIGAFSLEWGTILVVLSFWYPLAPYGIVSVLVLGCAYFLYSVYQNRTFLLFFSFLHFLLLFLFLELHFIVALLLSTLSSYRFSYYYHEISEDMEWEELPVFLFIFFNLIFLLLAGIYSIGELTSVLFLLAASLLVYTVGIYTYWFSISTRQKQTFLGAVKYHSIIFRFLIASIFVSVIGMLLLPMVHWIVQILFYASFVLLSPIVWLLFLLVEPFVQDFNFDPNSFGSSSLYLLKEQLNDRKITETNYIQMQWIDEFFIGVFVLSLVIYILKKKKQTILAPKEVRPRREEATVYSETSFLHNKSLPVIYTDSSQWIRLRTKKVLKLAAKKNMKRKEGESIRQWAKRIGVEHDQWLALYEKGRYEEKELSSEEKGEFIEYSKHIEDQIIKIQKERR